MTCSKAPPDAGFEAGPTAARTVASAYGAPALPAAEVTEAGQGRGKGPS